MRSIKLMPDYQCYPLWDMNVDEYGDIDPATLPISNLLCSQLIDWACAYDQTLNNRDPLNSGFFTVKQKNAFETEGRRLAMRLTEELGHEFVVEANF